MRDLLTDLKNIPKNAAIRKVNELVKRVRLAKAHMCIVGHLKKEMPAVFGDAVRTPEPPYPNPSRGSLALARTLDSPTLTLTLPLDPLLSHPRQLSHPQQRSHPRQLSLPRQLSHPRPTDASASPRPGKEKTQAKLLGNLEDHFLKVSPNP